LWGQGAVSDSARARASGERARARRELVAAVHATTSYSPAAAAATRPPAVAAAAAAEATGPEHEAVIWQRRSGGHVTYADVC
jgi:hypothetical protein